MIKSLIFNSQFETNKGAASALGGVVPTIFGLISCQFRVYYMYKQLSVYGGVVR